MSGGTYALTLGMRPYARCDHLAKCPGIGNGGDAVSFVHLGVLQERHQCTEDTTKDIEPSDACGEPLFKAAHLATSKVGGPGECRQYDDWN